MRGLLRAVVTDGTATLAEVEGYAVAGKTGTADKPKPRGGYYKEKVVATFGASCIRCCVQRVDGGVGVAANGLVAPV